MLGLRDSLLFDFQPLSKSSDIEEVRRNGLDQDVNVRYLGALVKAVAYQRRQSRITKKPKKLRLCRIH